MNSTSSKVKLVIIIIACLLVLTIVPTGIFCAVEKINPFEIVSANYGNTGEKILGKWQSEDGATAYEFYDTGRFDSYLSVISYSGTYEVNGKEITLKKIGSANAVTYKVFVTSDKLTLTLVNENGEEVEDADTLQYNKVEKIDTKTFDELLDVFKDELITENKE